jgi:hypothetical protein
MFGRISLARNDQVSFDYLFNLHTNKVRIIVQKNASIGFVRMKIFRKKY